MCPKCRELPTHYAKENTLWEEDSCVSNNRTLPRHSLSFVTGWMRTCSAFKLRGWELPGRTLSSLLGFESELHLDVAPHEGVCTSLSQCSRRIRVINSKNSKGPGSPAAYKSLTSNQESFWIEVMLVAATWMDLEVILLSEGSQKKTSTIWYHFCVASQIWHEWNYLWNRSRLTDIREQTVAAKRVWWGWEGLGVWD